MATFLLVVFSSVVWDSAWSTVGTNFVRMSFGMGFPVIGKLFALRGKDH